jgi:hypothetical protein
VEILEDLVEKPTTLHRDRPRLVDETRMVVVPIEPWAFEVIVERRRAEMPDLDLRRVLVRAVRLERLA